MKPKVSVIIPTFNRASFLSQAIQSVTRQSLQDIEVLVVDDGSQDETRDVVEPYRKNGSVRYFFQENKGVSAARNKGVIESTGTFLAFLDSDDLWRPEHLSRMVYALEQFDEAKIGFSGFRFIGEDADSEHQNAAFAKSVERLLRKSFSEKEEGTWISDDNLLATLFQFGFPFRIQGGVVSREFVETCNLCFDESISYTEDAQFAIEAAFYSRFVFIEGVGLLVRRHHGNVGDQCYQGKIVASYEQRKRRMRQSFEGKLEGRERRAFNEALWQISEYIMMERGRERRGMPRFGEAIRLLKEFPDIKSCKSVVKLFLQ